MTFRVTAFVLIAGGLILDPRSRAHAGPFVDDLPNDPPVSLAARCAALLETQEDAGEPVSPESVRAALARAQDRVGPARSTQQNGRYFRAALGHLLNLFRSPVRSTALLPENFFSSPEALKLQRVLAQDEMSRLRQTFVTRSSFLTPVRRITRGRAEVLRYLRKLDKVEDDNSEILIGDKGMRFAELRDDIRQSVRRRELAHQRLNQEALDSRPADLNLRRWFATWFGYLGLIPTDLRDDPFDPKTRRIPGNFGWMTGAGWFTYAWQHLGVSVRGFIETRRTVAVLRAAHNRERLVQREAARAVDVRTLIDFAERSEISPATVYIAYSERLPFNVNKVGRKTSLNSESILDAAAESRVPDRAARRVRVHHVLTRDETGELELVTLMLEMSRWEIWRSGWSSALAIFRR